MLQDVFNRIKIVQVIDPATLTADTNSTGVDLAGWEGVMFCVSFGESGDTLSGSVYWNCHIEESDDDSTYTDAAADDIISDEATPANSFGLVNAAADDDAVYSLGYKGTKRYARCVVDATGTHTNGTPIGAYAILFAPRESSLADNKVNP